MEKCKAVDTPLASNYRLTKDDGTLNAESLMCKSIIESLLYLTASRPDIMFSASLLSRFMQSPSQTHFAATKRVLRYIKGTVDLGLKFEKKKSFVLMRYCDSDWAGSLDDFKSTSGYCFSLGSAVFSWNSKKQEVVAQSSAKAEYIATATNHVIWLRKVFHDLGYNYEKGTLLFIDNKSAISIAKNTV
ncbi:PREDICTED: uncharacterized mitochondrial protein AtMg00810 [Theobroma cacao]|uniref:Uncharacterized mitochondrial protein AtMg00810 n=1 Tax=Theobroma cacao TaxID=3641 RepID=A0AB32W0V8_THECC|nr:PREDICTED: uncharacterized mitochondrial protein AtMg00810 [Theobroma cacao]